MKRTLHLFEIDIARRFNIGGKSKASPKGEWIKGYLLTFGEGYAYRMWKEYKQFAKYLGIKPGTYHSFAKYMYNLKKLGLIKLNRKESIGKLNRNYYTITPEMENSPAWKRPTQTLYPSTDWTIKPYRIKRILRTKYRH